VQLCGKLDHLLQSLTLPSERSKRTRVAHGLWVEQQSLDLGSPNERVGEAIAETQVVFFPYF
jgi:hypothetical protein